MPKNKVTGPGLSPPKCLVNRQSRRAKRRKNFRSAPGKMCGLAHGRWLI